MLNDPAVKDPDAGEEQLSGVKAALDCIEDFVDNMDMVSFNIFFSTVSTFCHKFCVARDFERFSVTNKSTK